MTLAPDTGLNRVSAACRKTIPLGLRGRFNLQRRCAKTLELRGETGWFDNLITDQGINWLGTGGFGGYCMVGNSSAPPLVTQTGLIGYLAQTNNRSDIVSGNSPSAPYYAWSRLTYRFDTGIAAGNISEVGMGRTGNQCFSRALVLDTGGSPTTITVLSDEILDVTYEFRIYPNPDDVIFDAVVSGVTYNCTLRPSNITGWNAGNFLISGVTGASPVFSGFAGPIGTVTQFPSGASAGLGTASFQAYSNNSLRRNMTLAVGLASGNLAGGIQSLSWATAIGTYQMQVNPKLMKDNTKTMQLTFGLSWARHTP